MPNAWLPKVPTIRAARAQQFRVGDVVRLLDETPATLRFWEHEFGNWLRPLRSKSGQRVYTAHCLDNLRTVQRLLRVELYTIEGAKRQLRLAAARVDVEKT